MRWVLVVALLASCGRGRGAGAPGASCRSDFDCAAGYCAGAHGHLVCTPSCLRDEECPDGWSCHGVTNNGVVVCAPGDAVPMPR